MESPPCRTVKWSLLRITGIFLVVRTLQYLLIFLTPSNQFDTSTQLLLDELLTNSQDQYKFWNRNIWNKLLSWDAVYFIKGMVGSPDRDVPEYEHEWAFSLIWIQLVRLISRSNSGTIELYRALYVGVLMENILFYLSAVILFFLTWKTFTQGSIHYSRGSAMKLSLLSSTLFILSSGSGFFTGLYSEPLSSFCTFLGMFLRESSIYYPSNGSYGYTFDWYSLPLYSFGSCLCFSLACLNRSNCLLSVSYTHLDVYKRQIFIFIIINKLLLN